MADTIKAASFAEWSFGNKAIEPLMLQGKYINARSTLIAAGPPSYSQISDSDIPMKSAAGASGEGAVYPLGFIENFALSQQKNIQRMYEIGSDRSYFIPGRTMSNASLGRVLFHGPSLLRVMYAYYPQTFIGDGTIDAVKIAYTATMAGKSCTPFIEESPGTIQSSGECAETLQSPTFYMNLASNLFDHPMGLLIYLKDINNEYYSAFYLELCYVSTHNLNINATSTVIAEGVGIQFDRIVPVNLST